MILLMILMVICYFKMTRRVFSIVKINPFSDSVPKLCDTMLYIFIFPRFGYEYSLCHFKVLPYYINHMYYMMIKHLCFNTIFVPFISSFCRSFIIDYTLYALLICCAYIIFYVHFEILFFIRYI